jgi:6,7-dimethyl-8-ribityllumazine synthase
MIKSIHKLLVPKREADFHALVDFFDALGLSRGESWKGRHNQGVKLHAPEAGVEIGVGRGFPQADLVVECDSADVLYESAKRRGFEIAGEIADCEWGARMFTVELPAGAGRLAIFSYNKDWRPRPQVGEGKLDAAGKRFGIVVSRFNAFITDRLLAGALDALRRAGASDRDLHAVKVPGAFEVPLAARSLAKSGKVDAVICLACIIRGETSHYEHLANEVTRGIGQSAQETGVPHSYGVLTCDSLEQAIDRAGLKMGNKGWDAALSAVEMASLAVASRQSSVASKGVASRRSPAERSTRRAGGGERR